MTDKEKTLEQMNQSYEFVSEKVEELNAELGKENPSHKTINELLESVKKSLETYSENAKGYAYAEIVERSTANGTPLFVECVKMLHYDVLKISLKKPKNGREHYETAYQVVYIDPADFEEKLGKPIAEKGWTHLINGFNLRLVMWAAKELDISDSNIDEINNSDTMKKYLKDTQEKTCVAYSNNQIQAAYNKIIAATIGKDYKANSHDTAFIKLSFMKAVKPKKDSNKSESVKLLKLRADKPNAFRMLITTTMYNIIMATDENSLYEIEIR